MDASYSQDVKPRGPGTEVGMREWDVAIVGAGPAGALAALAALRTRPRGQILLLDRHDFPRDKVCGDAVGPRCFDLLGSLGLGDLFEDYAPARELTLESRAHRARHPVIGALRIIPRAVFDARLVDAAIRAGAVLRRQRVRSLDIRP